jgi:hypothetical protein
MRDAAQVIGACPRSNSAYLLGMVTLAEIESLALKLPESQRAKLAADLLDSLPGVLVDDDEGLAEALRRSEEMDRDPGVCLSHDEFLHAVEL